MNFLESPSVRNLLDSVAPQRLASAVRSRLDAVDGAQTGGFALQTISMQAVAAVQTWAESDDLGEGEGAADRLIALLIGIADQDKDGELTEDEQAIVETAMNEAWNYMAAKGADEGDLDTLFNSDDQEASNAAGLRIIELLADTLPDGDDEAGEEMDAFVLNGAEDQEAVFDAVYKKKIAVRNGRKVMIRKRVSGTVRLSAKQKVAVRKMLMKSHGSKAMARRMKSMRRRKSMGL